MSSVRLIFIMMVAKSLALVLTMVLIGFYVKDDSAFDAVCSKYDSQFDYAIVGATLVDGSGNTRFSADLLTKGDSIVYVGRINQKKINARVIHAEGKVVSPGFIDVHTHGDPFDDNFENFVKMGVTSIILGQDGRSPVSPFADPVEFFDSLDRCEHLLNMGFLAGHGDLRERVQKESADTNLDMDEIELLCDYLAQDLKAGCLGISTGLEYLPGAWASRKELDSIAMLIGKYDRFIMSHLRSEDDEKMNESLQELIDLGRYCQVHVSHLKVVFGKNVARAGEILQKIDETRRKGIRISADVYPYMASYTGIGIVFPPWAKSRKDFELAIKNRRSELREYLHEKIIARNGPEATLFATRPFTGKTLAEVAEESGQAFEDILLKIGPTGASGAYFVMNESLQEAFITNPDIMISSDGGPQLRHPRSYGSFAKMIEKYVKQDGKISLEAAIHKMTGLSVKTLRLPRRGLLKAGHKADILIFNPDKIKAISTYENPFTPAQGFETVLINGQMVIENQSVRNRNSGQIIRNPEHGTK